MVAELLSTRMTPPIPYTRLRQITSDACESTFESADSYEHPRAEQWNTSIINSILQSLISESSSPSSPPAYKYAVNSTIIQHLSPRPTQKQLLSTNTPSTSTTTGANEATTGDEAHPVAGGRGDERSGVGAQDVSNGGGGRRGMHSATGAYWNTAMDGMWSYKYEAGEAKGFDVVICVIWMAV